MICLLALCRCYPWYGRWFVFLTEIISCLIWLWHKYTLSKITCSLLCSAPLRSCSAARLSTSSDGSTGSLTSLFVGNMDTADVFTIDDDQIQQLEEADTTVEMEPDFSPTVRKSLGSDYLIHLHHCRIWRICLWQTSKIVCVCVRSFPLESCISFMNWWKGMKLSITCIVSVVFPETVSLWWSVVCIVSVTIEERLQEIYEYAGERKLW